ncbi:unnamed protein product [Vitrella brassicaformis CCMP3155]|uniref:Uncharacterized protein n=1 Tax=Vitrella brassicaformis (strain CCMP3155) TaxID=1169540 RepID=A0A0G4EFR6_VITBC|nr:unnamed protein product [Vitrella brassicaformis CCMP3155]|eukprot:CEL94259.1 unnamed protein product [Vitrella brassicaformis CCMP3155]
MDEDELTQARDHFYVGNYDKAISLAEGSFPNNDMAMAERDALVARAKVAMGDLATIRQWETAASPSLQAVAIAAKYAQTTEEGAKRELLEGVKQLSESSKDATAQYLSAALLAGSDDLQKAVQETLQTPTLEMQALHIQILMLMDRVDLAEQKLEQMSSTNEDAAVTKLASCWVNQGTGNYQEAYLTYCDVQAQYPTETEDADESKSLGSVQLLNGKAVANMARSNWQEALEDLQRAQQQNGDDIPTLANLIAVYRHLRKDEDAEQCYNRLKSVCPDHPLVAKTTLVQNAFTRFKQSDA